MANCLPNSNHKSNMKRKHGYFYPFLMMLQQSVSNYFSSVQFRNTKNTPSRGKGKFIKTQMASLQTISRSYLMLLWAWLRYQLANTNGEFLARNIMIFRREIWRLYRRKYGDFIEGNMGNHIRMLSDVVMGSVKIFIGQYTPRIARTQKIMPYIILDVRSA